MLMKCRLTQFYGDDPSYVIDNLLTKFDKAVDEDYELRVWLHQISVQSQILYEKSEL